MSRFIIMAISLVAFGLSLAFPAIITDPVDDSYGGGICFLIGWMSLLMFWPMWLANPLLLFCLIFLGFKKYGIALGPGVAAIVLALCTLTIKQMMRDEGGTMVPVTGFGLGFYLWLLSMLVASAGSLVLLLLPKKAAQAEAGSSTLSV